MTNNSYPLQKYLTSMLLLFVLAISCKKSTVSSIPNNNSEVPDLSTKISSSVSGFVTDENNHAVVSATVLFGNANTTTDQYGYFQFSNVEVVKAAAVVTVAKNNYFHAIKTFAATPGKSAFFRIKLLPKTIAGTIHAANGGTVNLAGGLSISLPANGVVMASGAALYNGDIMVAANWLDPEAEDLTEIMPGDLRAIDKGGYLKGLTTFGMVAVELSTTSGELLQIAPGKKATLGFPLSSTLSTAAPATIPLWYLNEQTGLWQEDGTATKSGNSYTGEVSHFSYWNCDLPNANVPLTFTVVDAQNRPIPYQHVEIRPTSSNSWSHIGGNTDSSGYVSVFLTPDASYKLEIYNCNEPGSPDNYSHNFSVGTEGIDLGNVVTTASGTMLWVTGTATDCSGNPITDGYIIVINGASLSRYPLDNSGSYHYSSLICSDAPGILLIAHNNTNGEESAALPFTLVTGTNTISNLQACNTINSQEFLDFSFDGNNGHCTPDSGSVQLTDGGLSPDLYLVIANDGHVVPDNRQISFYFHQSGTASGAVQPLLDLNVNIGGPSMHEPPNMINIHITEYGAIGEFIAGNFSGTCTDDNQVVHNISCSFRMRRTL